MRFSLLSSQLPALVRPSNTDSRFSSPTTLASERSNTSMPLNCVVRPVRSISCASRVTSAWMAWRSDALLVSLAACTASSRMRCRLAVTLCSAPSAVCMSETPSLALRTAWLSPRICEVNRSEIARPAASSLALLMRKPEDRRYKPVEAARPAPRSSSAEAANPLFPLCLIGGPGQNLKTHFCGSFPKPERAGRTAASILGSFPSGPQRALPRPPPLRFHDSPPFPPCSTRCGDLQRLRPLRLHFLSDRPRGGRGRHPGAGRGGGLAGV